MLSESDRERIANLSAQVDATGAAQREATTSRDNAIREAFEAGATVAEIRVVTGLVRSRIYQIKDARDR